MCTQRNSVVMPGELSAKLKLARRTEVTRARNSAFRRVLKRHFPSRLALCADTCVSREMKGVEAGRFGTMEIQIVDNYYVL